MLSRRPVLPPTEWVWPLLRTRRGARPHRDRVPPASSWGRRPCVAMRRPCVAQRRDADACTVVRGERLNAHGCAAPL